MPRSWGRHSVICLPRRKKGKGGWVHWLQGERDRDRQRARDGQTEKMLAASAGGLMVGRIRRHCGKLLGFEGMNEGVKRKT